MRAVADLGETLFLSWKADGLATTARRVWERLWGEEELFVLVRSLTPPETPPQLPTVENGILVREMMPEDVDRIARLLPFELGRQPLRVRRQRLAQSIPDAFVAVRDGRIVGATWYSNDVTPEKPWFRAVEHQLVSPCRLTGGIFAVPGERAVAWVLARQATACLAARGVRTVIGCIATRNRPSLLVSRLLGGKIAAREVVSYRLGRAQVRVLPAQDSGVFGNE